MTDNDPMGHDHPPVEVWKMGMRYMADPIAGFTQEHTPETLDIVDRQIVAGLPMLLKAIINRLRNRGVVPLPDWDEVRAELFNAALEISDKVRKEQTP